MVEEGDWPHLWTQVPQKSRGDMSFLWTVTVGFGASLKRSERSRGTRSSEIQNPSSTSVCLQATSFATTEVSGWRQSVPQCRLRMSSFVSSFILEGRRETQTPCPKSTETWNRSNVRTDGSLRSKENFWCPYPLSGFGFQEREGMGETETPMSRVLHSTKVPCPLSLRSRPSPSTNPKKKWHRSVLVGIGSPNVYGSTKQTNKTNVPLTLIPSSLSVEFME